MERSTIVHYRRLPDGSETDRTWVSLDEAHGFSLTLASAGDMGPSGQPAEHRDTVLADAGYDRCIVLGVRQTHSRTVVDLRDEENMAARIAEGVVPEADGILFDPYTQAAGVTVADCMPILLVPRAGHVDRTDSAGSTPPSQRISGIAAILHSGYKGTGIVTEALNRIQTDYGVPPSDMRAVLGPCISGGCYAVPAERTDAFRREFGENTGRHDGGESFIDLRAANLNLLEAAGVPEITVFDDCTHCDARLGSYRRDGAEFTRMLAIAGRLGQ